MNPISIVFTINFTFLAIWGLMFTQVFNRPELIPLFMAFQTAFNFFFLILFILDKKRNLVIAFVVGTVFMLVLSLIGFFVLDSLFQYIKADEMITS